MLLVGNCLPYHQPEFLATKDSKKALGLSRFLFASTYLLTFPERPRDSMELQEPKKLDEGRHAVAPDSCHTGAICRYGSSTRASFV